MDLVLDTNIVLDHIDRREPFCELSRKVCLLGVVEAANTYVSASMLTDIYYLICCGKITVVKVRNPASRAAMARSPASKNFDVSRETFVRFLLYCTQDRWEYVCSCPNASNRCF